MNLRRLAAPLATPLKIALLTLVFLRLHGWLGAIVVVVLALLLFGADRAVGRWAMMVGRGMK